MLYLIAKTLITAVLVVAISEVGKRNLLLAGLLASIPLTSLLALVWLQIESGDVERTAQLSTSIMWLIPPSLVFLAALPMLLRAGMPPWGAFPLAALATGAAYWIYLQVIGMFGVRI